MIVSYRTMPLTPDYQIQTPVYSADSAIILRIIHCVQKKNTHSHFLLYLHE